MNKHITAPMGSIALASNILLAIFENLRQIKNKRQLFLKVLYGDLQSIFYRILLRNGQYWNGGDYFQFEYLKNLFVFSDLDQDNFSPILDAAVKQLQLAGMICWPDPQEPDLMRLDPQSTDYYEMQLLRNTESKLAYQDVMSAQKIAKMIGEYWPQLIVDRDHLMNLPG